MKRIHWIDIARGIGIILVIQAHSLSAHTYRHFIYAFHMPLFFFLSGLLFDYKKYSFSLTFKKSVRGILIPYLLFALLSYSIWLFQNNAFLNFDFSAFLYHLSGIIYGNSSSIFFNIVLWFLPCLFITKIIFAFISSKITNPRILFLVLILFSIGGYLTASFFPNIHLPFGLESALTAIVFFGVGSIIKTNYSDRVEIISRKKIIPYLFLSFGLLIIAGQINFNIHGEQIDIRMNHLGNYFLLYIGAISGIVVTLVISKLISKNKVLESVGINSLALFALHPIIFFYFDMILRLFTNINLWAEKDLYLSYFYTAVGIGTILFLVFIKKYIKFTNYLDKLN